MKIDTLLSESLILTRQSFADQSELFNFVHNKLLSLNLVHTSYLNGVTSREELYPTGLNLGNHCVAIPHTDSEHIQKDFLLVITFETPISFYQMDDDEKEIDVDMCVFFGLKEGKDNPLILQDIFHFIQEKETISAVISANSSNQVIDLIKQRRIEQYV